MWVTALIGSSTAFVEATLAQIHKEKIHFTEDTVESGLLYPSLYGRKDRKEEKAHSDCCPVCNFRSDLLVWNQPGDQ